jgi:hypothetical protein
VLRTLAEAKAWRPRRRGVSYGELSGRGICRFYAARLRTWWHHGADKCACGLTLDPPRERDYWWPSVDQPDKDLSVVVRHTEHPTYRRAIRADSGWIERGCSVEGTGTAGLIPPGSVSGSVGPAPSTRRGGEPMTDDDTQPDSAHTVQPPAGCGRHEG